MVDSSLLILVEGKRNIWGGGKYEIEIDINNFLLVGFEKDVKDVLGFRNLEKMHFRLPGRPLGDQLRLLYDNSVADMLKIVTEHNFFVYPFK